MIKLSPYFLLVRWHFEKVASNRFGLGVGACKFIVRSDLFLIKEVDELREAQTMKVAHAVVTIAFLGVAGYVLWILGGGRNAQVEPTISSWILILLDLFFAFLALRFFLQPNQDARLRSGWLLIAMANLSNAIAEILWFIFESVLHINPFPSVADLFYLLYYPLMLVGLLRFPFAPVTRRERIILWLDLGIVMIACTMLLWYFILAPLSLSVRQDPTSIIAIAYPVGDLLILAGIIVLIQRDIQKVTWRPMTFLGVGVLFTALADILFAYFETHAIPYSMPSLNMLWMASVLFQIVAIAYLIIESRVAPRTSALLSPASRYLLKQSLPYLAVGTGVGLLFFAINIQHYNDLRMWGVLYGTLGLVGLAMARQYAVLRENTLLYQQMKDIAVTDSLTGVYNRHFFNEVFPSEVERASRYRQPLTILIADVNNFKAVNDTYGHLKGDSILREIAQLLKSQLRSADTMARFGGDEFIILLPATDLEGARGLAERLKNAVASQSFAGMPLSLSVGLAQFKPGVSLEQMLEKADRELYRQKRQYMAQLRGEQRAKSAAKPTNEK
jgi:diguanylate cyclase (GGDEF)-like protein